MNRYLNNINQLIKDKLLIYLVNSNVRKEYQLIVIRIRQKEKENKITILILILMKLILEKK